MIALLLAAQLTAAAAPAQAQDSVLLQLNRAGPAKPCKASGRYQTANPEPTLLLRPQDRTRLKKLAELPMGEKCLAEAPQETAK